MSPINIMSHSWVISSYWIPLKLNPESLRLFSNISFLKFYQSWISPFALSSLLLTRRFETLFFVPTHISIHIVILLMDFFIIWNSSWKRVMFQIVSWVLSMFLVRRLVVSVWEKYCIHIYGTDVSDKHCDSDVKHFH